MKLQQKILLAPGIVIVFLVLFGMVALGAMRSQRAALEEIFVDRFGQFEFSTGVARQMSDIQGKAYRLFTQISGLDDKRTKAAIADINKGLDETAKSIDEKLKSSNLDEESRTTFTSIAEGMKKYRTQIGPALDMAATDVGMSAAMMQGADETFQKMEKQIEALVQHHQEASRVSYEGAVASFSRGLMLAAVILGLAVAGGLAVSFFLGRRIMKPLHEAADSATRIANGDLTAAIESDSKDEVGDLLRSLEAMRTNLRNMITAVRVSADEVGSATVTLASSANEVAAASEQQSENASSMAAAVEEMTVSINQMADNANQARELSRESGEVARQGGKVIHSTLDEMRRIASTVTETAKSISELGEQSAQVSKVVGVIKDIADQTNLLALNAAIEAARAGEEGRGFAVVADEVRKLAERTTQSTEEIRLVVANIQTGAEGAISDMDRAVSAVNSGVALAEQAGESTRQINTRTESVISEIASVSAALKDQSAASTDIAQRVERIATMAETNSASAGASATSAKRLNELSSTMREQIARFRI